MFKGKIVGIFGLVFQCAAVCYWGYVAITTASVVFTDPVRARAENDSVSLIVLSAVVAVGTAYCIYRQFKWVQENERFTAWLVTNAEKIRSNQLAYYRGQRISLDTELVRHHLVFSALIMSWRIQSRWIIKDKEPRFWNALSATLYTLFYGWWGIPFGILWTPIAVVKNITGATVIRVSDLLQPAPAKPVGFNERFQTNFSSRIRSGLFLDEKPAGILPGQNVAKV